jgi:transcriptional regulator with XRE-family HTH domain
MVMTKSMTKEAKKLNNIREVLQSRGIKASFIAQQLNCNPNSVYNWMHQRSQPSLSTLHSLSELIGCKLTDLINNPTQAQN